MSKINSKAGGVANTLGSVRYDGYAAVGHSFYGNLEGRILTLIDALGLEERQAKAVKNLVSQAIWSQNGEWPALSHEEVEAAWKRHYEESGLEWLGATSVEPKKSV